MVQYEVKIGFDVPEGSALKTGMSSSANIVINQHKNVLLVPNRAITQNKSGKPSEALDQRTDSRKGGRDRHQQQRGHRDCIRA